MWSIIQEALITVCMFLLGLFVSILMMGLLAPLLAWVVFLLKYLLDLMFWIWEKSFPPSKKEHVQWYRPESLQPPSQPMFSSCSLSINGKPEAIRGVVEEYLKETNDEQFY